MQDHPESPSGLSIPTTGGSYSFAASPLARTRSRSNSGATTPRIGTPSATVVTTPRAGSSPEIIDVEDVDLGDVSIPPPGYDEVSLDEVTPFHSRRNSDVSARTASPYPDPPPDYPGPGPGPGPAERRNNRLSAHMEGLAAAEQAQVQAQGEAAGASNDAGRNGAGVPPRLPSLRLDSVPQIVIEPSSARP
ncbi:hypothetical protein VTI74DRAFT_10930 [Chaetomium olivicolor]